MRYNLHEMISKHNKQGHLDNENKHKARIADIKSEIHSMALQKIDVKELAKMQPSVREERLRPKISNFLDEVVSTKKTTISREERQKVIQDLLDNILGLGPIEIFLKNPEVTEVMVNGYDKVYVEKDGKIELTSIRFDDDEHVRRVIDRIIEPLGRRIDESSPYADARLPDGSRVNVIIPPLIAQGPTITIRKFSEDPYTMDDLMEFGSLNEKMADFLKYAVEAESNILISGGTGSGKTTLLNALTGFIPKDDRIIIIEDTMELQPQQPHVLQCEARPKNTEGQGEVTIRDLVKNSLRMRPDRIVVGEVRGQEALDMMQAMNTGHDGSLTTIHSNSARDAVSRLETLVLMAEMEIPQNVIGAQIASSIDFIVQLNRLPDGSRKITNIVELTSMDNKPSYNSLYTYEVFGKEDGRITGEHRATGVGLSDREKFERNGVPIKDSWFTEGTPVSN